MAGSRSEVIKSLVVNLVIAASKGVGAAITGSGAMLAETLHSFADCGNQLLLLFGISQSQRPPDATHPLGHGRQMYFYSFVVALLLFSGGGMFSVYEGVHKLQHPGSRSVTSASRSPSSASRSCSKAGPPSATSRR